MIGESLYSRKSRLYAFLALQAALAIAGGFFAFLAIQRGAKPGNTEGFMMVFGAGMFIVTLLKGRKPQVVLREDFIEVNQSRKVQLVRYRNIVSVNQPDSNRLVVTLREDGERKNVTLWLRDLEKSDGDRLADFLLTRKWK